jgi:hypothetical protein
MKNSEKREKEEEKQIFSFFEDKFISLSLFHISFLIPCLRLDPQIRFYQYNIENMPILVQNIYLKRRILRSAIWVIFSLGRMKVKNGLCAGWQFQG